MRTETSLFPYEFAANMFLTPFSCDTFFLAHGHLRVSNGNRPTDQRLAASQIMSIAITVFIMLLPVLSFCGFLYGYHGQHEGFAFESLELWLLSAAVCVGRGLFLWRARRTLAVCCFAVVLLPLPYLVVPLLLLLVWLSGGH